MNNDNTIVIRKILNLYENSNFFKLYGLDFWIVIITILIFTLLITFFYISNHFNKVKQNWKNERCNPFYMPFAGYINPQKNMSKQDYAIKNFEFCNEKLIKEGEKEIMKPVYDITNMVNDIYNNIHDSVLSMGGSLNILKTHVESMSEIVLNKIISVLIPFQRLFIGIKDAMHKMIGSLVASIYTFYNLYKVIKLYFLNIIQITTTEVLIPSIWNVAVSTGYLITLLIYWGLLISLSWIPFIGEFFLSLIPSTITNIIISSISLALLLIFSIFIWICLSLLNNFANEIYFDVNNNDIPNVNSKIDKDDIKSTDPNSNNAMQK